MNSSGFNCVHISEATKQGVPEWAAPWGRGRPRPYYIEGEAPALVGIETDKHAVEPRDELPHEASKLVVAAETEVA